MSTSIDLEGLRQEYSAESLDISDVAPDPVRQFARWFDEALKARLPEPNAMTLATVGPDGKPSARVVLLKGFDAEGFVFFTNYLSRKASEMSRHPEVAAVFLWLELERQVRIEGRVEKIDPEESTRYFQSRPRKSQIGAWASPQSQVIESREWLEQQFQQRDADFQGQELLPRPEHWGGYLLRPDRVEFWQGRRSRLHDRILYRAGQHENWTIERLAP